MKTLLSLKTNYFVIGFALVFSFLFVQCSKESEGIATNKNMVSASLRTDPGLTRILTYGVSSPEDFDTLRMFSEYPFTVLSDSLFNLFRDSSTFDNNRKFHGGRFGIHSYLTENQFKIWFQIASHSNITLDYGIHSPIGVFLTDILYEPQYTDYSSNVDDMVVIIYNKAVMVEDFKDCPAGHGGCLTAL